MKISPWIDPYKKGKPGQTNGRFAIGRPGCYLVKNKDGKVVYVGMSASNVYKALYRHFQAWDDPTQVRITFAKAGGYKVKIYLTTEKQAPALEKALMAKHKPTRNPQTPPEGYQLSSYERLAMATATQTPVSPAEEFDMPF